MVGSRQGGTSCATLPVSEWLVRNSCGPTNEAQILTHRSKPHLLSKPQSGIALTLSPTKREITKLSQISLYLWELCITKPLK